MRDGSAEKKREQAGPELLPDQMTYSILQGVKSEHVLGWIPPMFPILFVVLGGQIGSQFC